MKYWEFSKARFIKRMIEKGYYKVVNDETFNYIILEKRKNDDIVKRIHIKNGEFFKSEFKSNGGSKYIELVGNRSEILCFKNAVVGIRHYHGGKVFYFKNPKMIELERGDFVKVYTKKGVSYGKVVQLDVFNKKAERDILELVVKTEDDPIENCIKDLSESGFEINNLIVDGLRSILLGMVSND